MPDKQRPRKRVSNKYFAHNNRWLWFVFVSIMLIAILLTNFFNKLYYSKPLIQDNTIISNLQISLNQEKADIKLLINSSSSQINCFNLRANYSQHECNIHNNKLKLNP